MVSIDQTSKMQNTIGKHATFLGFVIFLSTDEYNWTMFLDTETDKGTGNQQI
jgi:hypothetical protein